MILRRTFLTSLLSALAAPAIVRAESLMPVKLFVPSDPLVLGVRWQSWPFGEEHPTVGGIAQATYISDRKLEPLSYFMSEVDRYKKMYPNLVWKAIHAEEQ